MLYIHQREREAASSFFKVEPPATSTRATPTTPGPTKKKQPPLTPLTPSTRRKREEDHINDESTPTKKTKMKLGGTYRKQEFTEEAYKQVKEEVRPGKREEIPGEATCPLSELRDQGGQNQGRTISTKESSFKTKSIKDNPHMRGGRGSTGEAISEDGGGKERAEEGARELRIQYLDGGVKVPSLNWNCHTEDGAL